MLRIKYSGLSTKQLDYLSEQTIALSEINENNSVIANPVFDQVKKTHEKYCVVVMKQTYSGLGSLLNERDIRRDSYFLKLGNIVSGFAVFENSPKQESALLLKKIFDEAGSISHLGYANESVVIDDVNKKLSTPESINAAATLGVTFEVDALANAQREFNELYIEQVNANSDLRKQPSASSMRSELEDALRSYYGLVSAMKSSPLWEDIYSDLTELLKKF